MAKKTLTRKDGKKAELRPLTTDDLKAAVGGAASVPGNYKSSSGGGGTGY